MAQNLTEGTGHFARSVRTTVVTAALFLAHADVLQAEIDFGRDIRPLLSDKCFRCHGPDGERSTELRLDLEESAKAQAESGAAIIPFDPDGSRLIQRVESDDSDKRMPPPDSNLKLSADQIAILREWIDQGADWSEHWAFAALDDQVPRDVASHRSRNLIDRFIEARLTEAKLAPSPPADRRTLIRRLSFDLTGLPPTPGQVDAFLTDDAPDAWERLVEQYLQSPAFGERWGRVWLDLSRYADTTAEWRQGTDEGWRYRDWVIAAMNDDMPYDRFVRLQLAADSLAETELTDLPALGFLGLSPTYWKELRLAPDVIKRIVADEWDERIDTVTRTFLGLTVSCARCHDHKFDPITGADYYALAGVFASSQLAVRPLLPPEEAAVVQQARQEVGQLEEQLTRLDKNDHQTREKLQDQIEKLRSSTPNYDAPSANVMEDSSIHVLADGPDMTKLEYREGESQNLPIFLRGNPANPGPVVERRFLTALSGEEPRRLTHGSGRSDLAEALFTEARDLTARVIVNRIWEQHFNAGLVRTPSDFGSQGDPPSHPELVDHLAAELIRHDWSLKWLHRTIVTSATYRQSSRPREDGLAVDPENRLLWRMNRRRLEIEMLRDSMLAVAGRLRCEAGGPAFDLSDNQHFRRTVYGKVNRDDLDRVLRLFDFPEPEAHSPHRVHTTTPLQQLYLLNAPFVEQQSEAVAHSLSRLPTTDDRIHEAYRLLFSREPVELELAAGKEFVRSADDELIGLSDYIHTLIGLNEFLYVD